MSNYKLEEEKQILFDKMNVFFCFGKKQFDEKKIQGIKYIDLGFGMVCPIDNKNEFIEKLKEIYKKEREIDLKINGKKKIIWRELANYETQISGDISDTIDALENYPITENEIAIEYKKYFKYCVINDYF